jgi:hypothetical protein
MRNDAKAAFDERREAAGATHRRRDLIQPGGKNPPVDFLQMQEADLRRPTRG